MKMTRRRRSGTQKDNACEEKCVPVYRGLTADAAAILRRGGIGVIPTDTIYGIVCSAFSPSAISKIYRFKKRDLKKPLIVLISSRKDLALFGARPSRENAKLLEKIWPGKVSVILPCPGIGLSFLHRGTKGICFRLPDDPGLRRFLKITGPLVAPSANIQGYSPAKTIDEAASYFQDKVDFYIDGGRCVSKPSMLILFKEGKPFILRK
jgi:L-threonylcarbamoyladenylate synthase